MDISRQRRLLNLTTAGLLAATGGVVAWSMSGISDSEISAPSPGNSGANPETSVAQADDGGASKLAESPLRGPLYDPPPPPAPAPKPVAPPPDPPKQKPIPKLGVTLVGTIIEADQSVAIIADSTGKFDIKGIGESLELSPQGMVLESIDSEQVTVTYQGRESTVVLEKTTKKNKNGAAGTRGNNRKRNNR